VALIAFWLALPLLIIAVFEESMSKWILTLLAIVVLSWFIEHMTKSA
jgi:hypothetical protein